jgi:hypothetical protein
VSTEHKTRIAWSDTLQMGLEIQKYKNGCRWAHVSYTVCMAVSFTRNRDYISSPPVPLLALEDTLIAARRGEYKVYILLVLELQQVALFDECSGTIC